MEAAWILTNISAGTSEQTGEVVQSGCVPTLIELLSSPSSSVQVPINRGFVTL